jgi:hypothetical protein
MKLSFAVFLVFLTAAAAPADDVVRRYAFDYQGVKCSCVVSNSIVSVAPAWHEKDLAPPLPPRKADQIAWNYLSELFPEAKDEWVRSRISLSQVTKSNWIYEVVFTPAPGVGFSGPWPELRVVVLMNGNVVKYSRTGKWQRARNDADRSKTQ